MSINSLPAQPVTISASFVDSFAPTSNVSTPLGSIALSDFTQADLIDNNDLRSFSYAVNLNYNVPQSNVGSKAYLLDYIEYKAEIGADVAYSSDFCSNISTDFGTVTFSNCLEENLGSISLNKMYNVGTSTNNSLGQPARS